MTSEVKFDLIFEIRNLDYLEFMCMLPLTAILWTSEAMAASKQPRRSQMALELNSVASITYVAMLSWPLTASMA